MIRLGALTDPIMMCSFANDPMQVPCKGGGSYAVTGLYCAVSLDDQGAAWDHRRLITTDTTVEGKWVEGFDNQKFKMSFNSTSLMDTWMRR